jgi:hypothetical protein
MQALLAIQNGAFLSLSVLKTSFTATASRIGEGKGKTLHRGQAVP